LRLPFARLNDMRRIFAALIAVLLPAAAFATGAGEEAALMERARTLAREALLADTHIDAPDRLRSDGWRDLAGAVPEREFDYPRARAGGLDLVFMSIYIPSAMEAAGEDSRPLADALIDSVEAIAGRAPDKFALVRSPAEAEAAWRADKVGLALGLENGAPIAGELENLRRLHARGIRYITLAHALSNHLSDSSFDAQRPWEGLSPFGREVVAEMNRLGVMVDVSHLSDEAVRDVLAVSRAPVIASHSSARHFTPGFERNLGDELAVAIAEKGGIVHVNFGSSFLTAEANAWFVRMRAARDAWMEAEGEVDEASTVAWNKAYRAQQPFPFAALSAAADHIEHFIGLVGAEHVGLGSDFDGVGDSLPTGLKSVADFPNLIAELLRRGYPEADIRQILGGNLLRVWREVEDFASD
jgi:membrane dipeptidase